MNLKITLTVLATLLISLSTSYFIMSASGSDCNEDQNILKKLIDPKKKSIFIVGSSQTDVLNYGFINEQVSSIHPDYQVYNLALASDVPVRRLQMINQIVCSEPDFVFYGVAFRDFSKFAWGNQKFLTFEVKDKPPSILPDAQIFFQNWVIEPFDKNINPKVLTLKFLKDSISNFERHLETYSIVYPAESELAGESNLIYNLRADVSLQDFSKNENDAIALIGYPEYVDGVIGNALSFDANLVLQIDSDKLTNSDFNFNSSDQFSISYWMKTDYPNHGRVVLISKSETVTSNGWSIYFDGNGASTFRQPGTPNRYEILVMDNSGDIRDGKWRHFVWTYDGSENSNGVSLYINGSKIQLDSIKNDLRGSTTNNQNIIIGAQGNHILKVRADLDDIRIYNDELSSFEARNLFEMGGFNKVNKNNIENSTMLQYINFHQAFAEQIVQLEQEETTNLENNANPILETEIRDDKTSNKIWGPDEFKERPKIMEQGKLFAQIDPYTFEKNSKALKKIINVLHDNEIKVVLFTVPHSAPIIEQISDSDYNLFNSTMQDISNEYNVPVYSLLENYSSLKVWKDTYHVTKEKEGIIYSEDVTKIILDEITR